MALKRDIHEKCKGCGETVARLVKDGIAWNPSACKCPKPPGPQSPPRTLSFRYANFIPADPTTSKTWTCNGCKKVFDESVKPTLAGYTGKQYLTAQMYYMDAMAGEGKQEPGSRLCEACAAEIVGKPLKLASDSTPEEISDRKLKPLGGTVDPTAETTELPVVPEIAHDDGENRYRDCCFCNEVVAYGADEHTEGDDLFHTDCFIAKLKADADAMRAERDAALAEVEKKP